MGWRTYAENGDILSLHHRTVWIYNLSAQREHHEGTGQCLATIFIDYSQNQLPPHHNDDNVIAALEQHDRVSGIRLPTTGLLTERFTTVMQEPFPALTHLELTSDGPMSTLLPDALLGGSAPLLRTLTLERISFPAFLKLLLTASNLVNLHLIGIPVTGYISPQVMVTVLSTLTQLRSLSIDFESPGFLPDRTSQRPPLPTHAVLTTLTILSFRGVSEYFEDLFTGFDAPHIRYATIDLFNQLVFDIPQFTLFIGRTDQFKSPYRVVVVFKRGFVCIRLGGFHLSILSRGLDWQVSSMAQICSQSSTLLSSVEELEIREGVFPSDYPEIYEGEFRPDIEDDIDSTQWPELFRPFTAVKTL